MNRVEKAVELKNSGSNCTQSILLAYQDLVNLTEEQLTRLGSYFQFGMGNATSTCGGLLGAALVLGALQEPGNKMAAAKALNEEFKQKAGALICKELKGLDTGICLCPCSKCVEIAAELIEERLRG